MSLWSKGVDRSLTNNLRKEDILDNVISRLKSFMTQSGYPDFTFDPGEMSINVTIGDVHVSSDLKRRKFKDLDDFSVMVNLHEDIVFTHKHVQHLSHSGAAFANKIFRNMQDYLKSKYPDDLYKPFTSSDLNQ